MTDLDAKQQHEGTLAAWHTRYGGDSPDGSVVTWTQNGWRWMAERREGAWWIAVLDPAGGSRSTTRPHTWDMLCSRLVRMQATLEARWTPGEPDRPTVRTPRQYAAPVASCASGVTLPTGPGGYTGDTLSSYTPGGVA